MKKLFLILPFLFLGCGSGINYSETQVINGVETSSYPAVTSLKLFHSNGSRGLCTGTFIKSNLILTAAHCVDGVKGVEALGHRASRIIYNSKHSYTWEGLGHDFALVEFSEEISPNIMEVSTTPLLSGQIMTLIGYGINTYIPYREGSGSKRIGFNTYRMNDYLARGIVQFEGLQLPVNSRGTYLNASVGQGDSGGPLIANGKIVGVASAQALYNDVNSSYYSYTVGENFKDFMFRASKVLEL